MPNRLRTAGSILKDAASQMGTDLRSFDDAYSEKIAQLYANQGPIASTAGYLVGGAHPSLRKGEVEGATGALKAAMEYGIPAANAVPKYVLPAAGVTLAGQALIDLARVIQGDQQTDTTLGIDAGEVAAASLVGGGIAAGPSLVEAIRRPIGAKGPGIGRTAAVAAAGAGAMAGVNAGLQALMQ